VSKTKHKEVCKESWDHKFVEFKTNLGNTIKFCKKCGIRVDKKTGE